MHGGLFAQAVSCSGLHRYGWCFLRLILTLISFYEFGINWTDANLFKEALLLMNFYFPITFVEYLVLVAYSFIVSFGQVFGECFLNYLSEKDLKCLEFYSD